MKRVSLKLMLQATLFLVTLGWGIVVYANQFGYTDATRKPGSFNVGCTCHGELPSPNVVVSILGPDTLLVGQSANYSLVISGGPAKAGGTDIAASAGMLNPISPMMQVFQGELTHTQPVPFEAGQLIFQFSYRAPATAGQQTLYANGNSVNRDSTPSNDQWNFAPDKRIIVLATSTLAENGPTLSPSSFELLQNYPNPFNPSTMIRYTLPSPARASLRVFDLNGREVATLVDQQQSPGWHEVQFVASGHLASGTYVYTLVAGSFVDQKKMVLVK